MYALEGLSPAFIEHWAIELLRQKGRQIDNQVSTEGGLQFKIDGEWRTRDELVAMARQYPEWRHLARKHEEYLREALV
jgi:hypothetical protein